MRASQLAEMLATCRKSTHVYINGVLVRGLVETREVKTDWRGDPSIVSHRIELKTET